MPPAPKTLVAVTSFGCEVKGAEYVIRQGDVVPASHPVVRGREELFQQAGAGEPVEER